MTVQELATALKCETVCMPEPERDVTGGYAGDLLSWVMGRANAGDVWVTIMSNVNIIAVSTLADPACVLLAENVVPDEQAVQRAKEQGINLFRTEMDTFSACAAVAALL